MKRSIVKKQLNLGYQTGSLNPTEINEQFLESVGIIDEDNKLDKGMLRIGSLGTNIFLLNDSEDEINIKSSSIEISSKDKNRIEFIVNKIKDKFENVSLISARYEVDEHFDDASYPSSIFDKYTESDILLDVIRFKKRPYEFTVYSCAPKRIHINTEFKKRLNLKFSDFSFEENLNTKDLNEIYQTLILDDLKIEKTIT